MKIGFLFAVFFSFFSVFGYDGFKVSPMHSHNGGNEILSRINAQDAEGIEIEYRVPMPEFNSVSGQEGVSVSCGNTMREVIEGKPVMPYIVSKILLPPGKTVASLNIDVLDSSVVMEKVNVEYGSAPVRLIEGAQCRVAKPDALIYGSTRGYPEKSVMLHSVQKRRGVLYAIVKIYPVTFYPSLLEISYKSSFKLRVMLRELPKESEIMRVCLKDFQTLDFENPEMINAIGRDLNNRCLSTVLRDNGKRYSYVIITNEEMRSSTVSPNLKSLADQRNVSGFSDTIVTVESIYQEYLGVDKQEKVRSFIKDAYNVWETDFVLLGGDSNIVPVRFINVVDGEVSEVASDAYYQCLDGSYNDNGNELWGEANDGVNGQDVDLSPDVFLGRASAENVEEMSNFVSKVIAYEKSVWSKNSFLTNAVFVGEKLMNLKDSVSYGKFYMDEIKEGSNLHGYSTKGFSECSDVGITTVYEYDNDWPSDGIKQQEFMRDKINSNEIGYINHLGHSTLKKNMKMYRGQERFLSNSNPVFHYSQGCFVGRFEDDCFGERFISENRGGMWSAVLNSHWGIGRSDNTDGASQALQRQFWDAYFGEGKLYVGECFADQREDNIHRVAHNVEDPERWGYFVSNLLGVPATKFRIYGDNTGVLDSKNKSVNSSGVHLYAVNSSLRVSFVLPSPSNVELSIYGLSGRLLKNRGIAKVASGYGAFSVGTSDLSSGLYLVKVSFKNVQVLKKVIIR